MPCTCNGPLPQVTTSNDDKDGSEETDEDWWQHAAILCTPPRLDWEKLAEKMRVQ